MSLTTKINALVISVALLLSLALGGLTALREYRIEMERLLAHTSANVLAHPELQFYVYKQDQAGLERTLQEFLKEPAIIMAAVHSGPGKLLAELDRSGTATAGMPPLREVRVNLPVAEAGLVGYDSEGKPGKTGLLAALAARQIPMQFTTPLFTTVNPGQRGLGASDFVAARLDPKPGSSLRVMGYLQLAIDRSRMLDNIGAAVSQVFFFSLVVVGFCGAVAIVASRRITRPLSQLTQLAEKASAGHLTKPMKIKGNKEITEIANALNSVLGGLEGYKQELNVDQKLLSMKVDERNNQLSQRDLELHRAVEEVTETKNQLHRLAYYDSLTSLPNRRLFSEQLDLLLRLNERNGHTLALLFVDLDNFKRVNDSLGHSAGDQLLQEVGKRLGDCVRESDAIAHYGEADSPNIDVSRLGGDEFTVVLNQLDNADSAATVAQRLISCLKQPMSVDGHEVVVTPSIGIAIAPLDGSTVENLLKAAGTAMYHAKSSNKDEFLYFDKQMDAASVDRIRLESELRLAIQNNELELHYQPQVDTRTGSIAGAEALLRWTHPERGRVPTDRFLRLAHDIGMMVELGDWVLEEACRQMKTFEAEGLKLPRVAINVAPAQFTTAFIQRVREVLQQYEMAPAMLELGLTEAIMMEGDKTTLGALHELHEMGVYLSVDDFGTSYAPLTYLSRYPLDEIKIDRSFVVDFDRSENGARVLGAIIAMARSLEMNMVAEGVETKEQYNFLADNGAHVVQGYLFSEPVPADRLRPMLAPWHFTSQVQEIAGTG